MTRKRNSPARLKEQRGWSLIIVMMIIMVSSLLGVASMRMATLGERSARADRDTQVAWQSAEAALMDAEFDMFGPGPSARRSVFAETPDLGMFKPDCGNSGLSVGLCTLASEGKPVWLLVEFDSAQAATFGEFTGRTFPVGVGGAAPAQHPRYVIEPIRDPADRDLGSTAPKFIYRVTAMGFGPRASTYTVLQTLNRL